MESLAFLLIILIFLLMFSYVLCDRDMMAPDVLYIAGFVLAVIAASMNVSAWGIDLSAKTIMIILIGVLSFVSVGMLYRFSHKKYAFQGDTEIEHIQVARWKNVLVIAFGILTMVLYYKEAVRLSAYADSYWKSFGVMVAYKRVISYGDMSLNPVVNQMTKMVYSFGYVYMFIFMNNVFASKENHRIRRNAEYLIPAFLFVAMSIIKGNRVDIMQLVVMAVFLYYMFLHRKVGWNKHISGKMLKKAIMVFAIGMVLFYYMKELVGRVSSLNFLEYITQYIGGSIQLLDQYVRESSHVIDVPFGETLTGLITGLRKLGLTTASLRKQLEFRYTPTGIYLGNVYTALRRYYNDAGWIGVVVFPAILSLIMNAFYRKVRLYKDNTIKHVYKTIVYASLLYVVPFQAMEDSFYINKVTIGYAMELTILYVCVLFVFKKIRLR